MEATKVVGDYSQKLFVHKVRHMSRFSRTITGVIASRKEKGKVALHNKPETQKRLLLSARRRKKNLTKRQGLWGDKREGGGGIRVKEKRRSVERIRENKREKSACYFSDHSETWGDSTRGASKGEPLRRENHVGETGKVMKKDTQNKHPRSQLS